MDYSNLSSSKNLGAYLGFGTCILGILSMVFSNRHEKKMDKQINALHSLSIEEFKKRFSEMYGSANDNEKGKIMRSFKRRTNEHILKVDTFIEETRRRMKLDEALEIV